LVFFLRGFSSDFHIKNHQIPRSLVLAALLTALLLIPLTYFSLKFFKEASENRLINTVVANEVRNLGGAELVELKVNRNVSGLDMIVTIRTGSALRYEQVVNLQKAIVEGIHQPVSLKVSQVIAENLDPLIPPTPTFTPTQTPTSTPGPSPTATNTPTPTKTSSLTFTLTATSTSTFLPSITMTPGQGKISRIPFPDLKMYQNPGGPVIGNLLPGQEVTILYGKQIYNGLVWIEVQDAEHRVGWVPEVFIRLLLPTLTATTSSTPTLPTPALKKFNTIPPPLTQTALSLTMTP
jgi:hypothetical protein